MGMVYLSRIKLQIPVCRCSGCPKGSSSFFACSPKEAPSSCWGSFIIANEANASAVSEREFIYPKINNNERIKFI